MAPQLSVAHVSSAMSAQPCPLSQVRSAGRSAWSSRPGSVGLVQSAWSSRTRRPAMFGAAWSRSTAFGRHIRSTTSGRPRPVGRSGRPRPVGQLRPATAGRTGRPAMSGQSGLGPPHSVRHIRSASFGRRGPVGQVGELPRRIPQPPGEPLPRPRTADLSIGAVRAAKPKPPPTRSASRSRSPHPADEGGHPAERSPDHRGVKLAASPADDLVSRNRARRPHAKKAEPHPTHD